MLSYWVGDVSWAGRQPVNVEPGTGCGDCADWLGDRGDRVDDLMFITLESGVVACPECPRDSPCHAFALGTRQRFATVQRGLSCMG